jgi:hypothetical protein
VATTPADVQRKVRQLENDVLSIYDMLRKIEKTQRRHGVQLTDLSAGQASLEGRLTSLEGGQARHEAILVEHGSKLDAILELLRPR